MTGFRCPSCAQAHEMNISDAIVIKQNKEMTEFHFYTFDRLVTDDHEENDIMETIDKNPEYNSVCPECKEVNPVFKWRHAVREPLAYFEMEQLCHCGGELWMDQIPGTSQYGFVCDKCNWVKPKTVVSGG